MEKSTHKEIKEYPGFLSHKECREVLAILDKNPIPGTGIQSNAVLAQELIAIVGPKLPQFSFTSHVSTGNTKEAIGKHTDPLLDPRVTHKLLVYLKVPSNGGGTFFNDTLYIKPEEGKAVIFDITISHHGEWFPKGELKRVFGLRMFKKLPK